MVAKLGGHVTGEGGLIKELESFGGHVEDAAVAAASMPIGTALKEFVEHYSPGLKAMVNKTGSVVTGAVKATMAYLEANREMAEEAQRNAINAPAPRIGR
ncbi:hypothetical protein DPM19_22030 [Actinomadura craniellae]|uniref:ESX-1 secretion-associated protein n=1 Tax=Actinomadura craniellae TaxID=2231787 RepID=A0A365H240_9ACTN|nr:hypothetical protein DPM19_22030 [Actinomadura craniellae]